MNRSLLAQTLIGFRSREGLSQRGLAKKCSLTPSAVARIEDGSRWPTRETIIEMAEALKLEPFAKRHLLDLAGFSLRGRR